MNSRLEPTVKQIAKVRLRCLAGRALIRVRGFSASMRQSAIRLNAMAALRAPTMASRIHNSLDLFGTPPEARMALNKANGKAKTVCSNLIISRVVLKLAKTVMRNKTFG